LVPLVSGVSGARREFNAAERLFSDALDASLTARLDSAIASLDAATEAGKSAVGNRIPFNLNLFKRFFCVILRNVRGRRSSAAFCC